MSRRANGEGTTYRQGKGWIWELHHPKLGRVRAYGRTQAEAKTGCKAKIEAKLTSVGKLETIDDLCDAYVAWVQVFKSPSVRRARVGSVANWIRPHLGQVLVHELTSTEIEDVFARIMAKGNTKRTDQHVKMTLVEMLDWAVKGNRVAGFPPSALWNPAVKATLPYRGDRIQRARAGVAAAADPGDVAQNLAYLEDRYPLHPCVVALQLIAELGTRPSEALGLRTHDFYPTGSPSEPAAHVHILGALRQPGGKGTEYLWTPGAKNGERGLRRLALQPMMVGLLGEHLRHQKYEVMKKGWDRDSVMLFRRDTDGAPLSPQRLNNWLADKQRRFKLPPFAVRQLRHTVATHLANVAGWTPYDVAAHLGDTLEVALSHYIEPPSGLTGTAERVRMPYAL